MLRALLVPALCAAPAACGLPPNTRLLTRPGYHQQLAFDQFGREVDLKKIVEQFPSLKGKVVTAPEYLEELSRTAHERKLKGEPVYEYRIRPGTSLDIVIVNEPDFSRQNVFVPPDGYDDFPWIGRVQLADRTRAELKKELEERYRKLFKRPEVNIHIRPGTPQFIGPSQLGQLPFPLPGQDRVVILSHTGVFQGGAQLGLLGGETLFTIIPPEALSAGAEWRQIRVIRRADEDPLHKGRIIFCDAWKFIAEADVRQDIPLRPGDFIFIPTKHTLGEQLNKDLNLGLNYAGLVLQIDDLIREYNRRYF
jgi:hypothetical protein